MDPITSLLNYLRNTLQQSIPEDVLVGIEATAKSLFARFELVPKHEFEAQLQILASLEQQVATLERRLAELEQAS